MGGRLTLAPTQNACTNRRSLCPDWPSRTGRYRRLGRTIPAVLGHHAQEATGMSSGDWATLTVAIVGAATGISGLIWQAVTWRRSGPRISIDVLTAWVNEADGEALTHPIDADFSGPPATGFTRRMLGVEVQNSGRAATTVNRVAVVLSNGVSFFDPRPAIGPGFPKRWIASRPRHGSSSPTRSWVPPM
jgi:hypothetical protein